MNSVKTTALGVALLLGASTAVGSASASPLSSFYNQFQTPSSNVELVAQKKWRYDRSRHGERFRKRDRNHRFHFGGFWYAQPFWTFGVYPLAVDRLSCAEARRIVDRRFNRVRTIECRGATYTFRAVNRNGRRVVVTVNARTGNYW